MKTFEVTYKDYIGDEYSQEIQALNESDAYEKMEIDLSAYYGWGNCVIINIEEWVQK